MTTGRRNPESSTPSGWLCARLFSLHLEPPCYNVMQQFTRRRASAVQSVVFRGVQKIEMTARERTVQSLISAILDGGAK